jgi:hypothetical protein
MKGSPSAEIEEVRRLAGRLVHDVGKYVARTAHNVAPGDWTPELAGMLRRDLYQLAGGRASVVFEVLASPVEALAVSRPQLAAARGFLAEIDRLEPTLRAGEVRALDRAAALALAVEKTLRDLVRDLSEDTP